MPEAEYVKRLLPLESFDANAFIDADATTQDVCDFVLALALIFNDLRDLVLAQRYIRQLRPEPPVISPQLGEFYGLHAHWIRLLAGLLKALAEVIAENEKAITDPTFQKVIKLLPKTYREAWQNTVNAAIDTSAKGDRFGRMIFFVRNKAAFHYDPKEIMRGYKQFFIEKKTMPPYVSRDDAMEGTRLYFADAAAEQYLMYASGAKDATEFFESGWKIPVDISHALREIVLRFVNTRSSWRKVAT